MSKDIILSIGVVLYFTVYITAINYLIRSRKRRQSERKQKFFKTLIEGLKSGSISSLNDVVNIYKGIFGFSVEDLNFRYSLSRLLREFLVSLISKDGKTINDSISNDLILRWKEMLTEFINQNEKISPYAVLPETERNILTDISVIIEKNDFENDKYLQKYLDNSIDWSFKKRYDSFTFNKKIDIGIPIISFYSYKGGVGRTSTLVTFANYLSYHYGKNIVILDFDFEAPGVINFFDIDFTQNSKNGVIEFILDTQVSKNYDFNNYFIEVSKTFTGEGSIYIIPAGNISDLNNINSYIEGLSRIDINSAETIIEKIENLFKTVKKELCPDLILIDCRTGINDIFGLLV